MVKPLNKASGVTSGTTLAGGGKLTPEQSDKFITTVVENSTFLKKYNITKWHLLKDILKC